MTGLPGSFAEVRARLASLFGGGPGGEAAAAEWLREALEAAWRGAQDEVDLPVVQRGLALQKASGALLALEDVTGDLAFRVGLRGEVAAVFARYFRGVVLDGPPWRLDPTEGDRPEWRAWLALSDFDDAPLDGRPAPMR